MSDDYDKLKLEAETESMFVTFVCSKCGRNVSAITFPGKLCVPCFQGPQPEYFQKSNLVELYEAGRGGYVLHETGLDYLDHIEIRERYEANRTTKKED